MAVGLDSIDTHTAARTRFMIEKLKTSKTVSAQGRRPRRLPDDNSHRDNSIRKWEKNPRRGRKDQVGDITDGNNHSYSRRESESPRSLSPKKNSDSKRTGTLGRRIGPADEGESAQTESSIEGRGVEGRFNRADGRKREELRLTKEDGGKKKIGGREEPGRSFSESRKGKYGTEISRRRPEKEDSAALEERPKRSKRIIRIDPYDITNKRIDDGVPAEDIVMEKEAGLSLNAQFRAIKPSPSILSFVEDNLLGRRRRDELKKAGFNMDLSAALDNIPFSTKTERERIEESVFRNKLEFFAAAKVSTSFPPPILPEIAFAGRSNVGKSSLLNALTRQWGVVRTSDKPGLTQTINFFRLASKLCLVDLPGYGFAYAKDEVKDSWEELVKEYVSTRQSLQRVCVLIDTKWGMKPRDQELINLMERSKTPYQIVLTKTDLVFPMDVARRAMQIQEDLKTRKSAIEPVMMVSSQSGAGIRSLRTVLAKLARFMKP